LCFQGGDNNDAEWVPQGITTVADAQADQQWGGSKPLLVGWYNKNNKGVRVTFINRETKKYRHVLLAYPTINSSKNPSYMTVRTKQENGRPSLHAGGMKWYGNY